MEGKGLLLGQKLPITILPLNDRLQYIPDICDCFVNVRFGSKAVIQLNNLNFST